MAGYPPGVPPVPPPGYDPRAQRRFYRDQIRAQRDAARAHRQQMRYQMRGFRRGSILGPVLLIAIGLLFLFVQSGRLDHHVFWEWYAHWWPLLLVGAGVIVLVEWAFDQYLLRTPETPQYRRSMGAGAFILLFFLAVTGVIASSVHEFPSGYSKMFPGFHFDQDSMDELFGDKHESDQTVELDLLPGGSLTVVNPRGDVAVNGTSDDGRMHVAIHKQVYARSDSDAEARAKEFSPASATDGSATTLTMPSVDGARADLVITVPAAAALTITDNHGDVHVGSIKAAVAVTANHGDVELAGITGQVVVHTNSGGSSMTARSIEGSVALQGHANDLTLSDVAGPVTLTGEFFGTTHLEHINGPIHFHTSRTDLQFARLDGETEISSSGISADQVMGPVVVSSSNRNITLERLAGDIAVTNRNGTIDLTAAPMLGNVTLQDRNGSVKATLPEHAGFSVQAATSNGDVNTNFPLSANGTENHKNLAGTVGSGGPQVHITTSNGDISLMKGDIAPLPPTPPAAPKFTLAPPAAPEPATPSAPAAPRPPKHNAKTE